MAARLSEAKHYVHITGWHLAPSFELIKGRPHGAIGVLLAELAERVDVRVLVWSGAPVPAFHPTRGEVAETLRQPDAQDPDPGAGRSRASTRFTAITRRRS